MLSRAKKKHSAEKKNVWQSRKVLSIAEKCLAKLRSAQHIIKILGRAEQCLAWKKNAWQSRIELSREEKQLGTAAMCI